MKTRNNSAKTRTIDPNHKTTLKVIRFKTQPDNNINYTKYNLERCTILPYPICTRIPYKRTRYEVLPEANEGAIRFSYHEPNYDCCPHVPPILTPRILLCIDCAFNSKISNNKISAEECASFLPELWELIQQEEKDKNLPPDKASSLLPESESDDSDSAFFEMVDIYGSEDIPGTST